MAAGQERADFAHGQDVLTLLNRDLANEMNSMLTYLTDSLLVRGIDCIDVKEVANKFALQEFTHVRRLAARVVELEGIPQLMPLQLQDNASITAKTSTDGAIQPVLKDALENELQSVIEYRSQIQQIGFSDPTTCLLLEEILADKEHQVEEVRNLLGI